MHAAIRAILLAALAGAAAPQGVDEARRSITADGIRGHLAFLSHDLLEGRAPGTRGGRLAAEYIAARMMASGLAPVAGNRFQPVLLLGATVRPETVRLEFRTDDDLRSGTPPVQAAYPTDALVWTGPSRAEVDVEGDVVFVGYGIQAPEWDWDDYAGQDMTGKIALILIGDPPSPPEEPALFDGRALTYYGRWSYKVEEARRHGAAGALLVHRADGAGYGWDVVASSWTGEQLMLPEGRTAPPMTLNGWVSGSFVRRILALAGHDLDELYVRAARRDFRPVRTGIRGRGRMVADSRRVRTRNVVGMIPGRDPARAGEVVVYTAHYDHLGVGAPDSDGDSIFNGAYDNASGVGVLLAVARAFARLEGDDRPARSVLFIATAAEEGGMLGARHYVAQPLLPLRSTVAALNIDGASVWGETEDVIGLGAELSTLGAVLDRNARAAGLTVRSDPAPQAGTFFRSDHFPFAQAGVPVLYVEHGLRFRDQPEGWGEELMDAYLRDRYHRPGDEYRPDFDLAGAVQQARLLFDVGLDIANGPTAPQWLPTASYRTPRERAPR